MDAQIVPRRICQTDWIDTRLRLNDQENNETEGLFQMQSRDFVLRQTSCCDENYFSFIGQLFQTLHVESRHGGKKRQTKRWRESVRQFKKLELAADEGEPTLAPISFQIWSCLRLTNSLTDWPSFIWIWDILIMIFPLDSCTVWGPQQSDQLVLDDLGELLCKATWLGSWCKEHIIFFPQWWLNLSI